LLANLTLSSTGLFAKTLVKQWFQLFKLPILNFNADGGMLAVAIDP
jgi:hypothetical protein